MADDLMQGSTNRATQVPTTISLPTRGHCPSAIKSLMGQCSSRPLGFAKAGHVAACNQLPLVPNRGQLAANSVRDPQSGGWGSFPPNARPFGGAAAAHQYNCLSRIIAALAIRLLKIPTMGYSDDFGLIAFSEMDEIVGFELNSPKSEWGQAAEFSGRAICLSPFPSSLPLLCCLN